MTNLQEWETVANEHVGDFKIFTMRQAQKISPRTGRTHTFYIIDSNDWVNIFPLTADGHVVMVRQYRHGNDEFTLEVPGGLVEPNEDPMVSALREMREETGYDAAMKRFLSRRPKRLKEEGEPYPRRDELHERDMLR